MKYICLFLACILTASCEQLSDEQRAYNEYIDGLEILSEDSVNDVAVDRIVCVILEGNASTGYWWYYAIDDGTKIALYDEETFDFSEPDSAGSPVTAVWKFQATASGNATIVFRYYRYAEGPETSIDTRAYTMQITQ